MPLIELDTISFAYPDGVPALRDVSLRVAQGERLALLGEDHTVATEGAIEEVLADRELLLRVNLIHEHAHYHGTVMHVHPHAHLGEKQHEPGGAPSHEHVHEQL